MVQSWNVIILINKSLLKTYVMIIYFVCKYFITSSQISFKTL